MEKNEQLLLPLQQSAETVPAENIITVVLLINDYEDTINDYEDTMMISHILSAGTIPAE